MAEEYIDDDFTDVIQDEELKNLLSGACEANTHQQKSKRVYDSYETQEWDLTPAKLDKYLLWRAMEKSPIEAAALSQIGYDLLTDIENANDIVEAIATKKLSILNNPAQMLDSMVPAAFGVLAEKVAEGNISAIRTIIEMSTRLNSGKTRDKTIESIRQNETSRFTETAGNIASTQEIERIGKGVITRARERDTGE